MNTNLYKRELCDMRPGRYLTEGVDMEWVYVQSTGELFLRGGVSTGPFAVGYAGSGAGRNNPQLQCVKDIGPIPRGWYTFDGVLDEPAPFTIRLQPDASNDMCNRTGFLIHAENSQLPGWASQGCIVIADPAKRERIANSGVVRLQVVEQNP